VVLVSFAAAAVALRAQDKNPFAGDAKARAGRIAIPGELARFATGWARGAEAGGLISAARRNGTAVPTRTYRTINEGVPGTAMPPNGATQQGVG